MSDLCVIIPSRGRPHAIKAVIEAWQATSDGLAELIVCLDLDDPTLDDYPKHLPAGTVQIARRNGFAPRLSDVAVTVAPHHHTLASWGDDHIPRTAGWDTAMVEALQELGTGFVYGDDGIQGEYLPTACAMTSNIIGTLGWMTPPGMAHMFIDNVWLELGRAIDRIRFLPEVVVEHMHPCVGKSEWDDLYRETNALDPYNMDLDVFERWKTERMRYDADKLRTLL